MTGTRVWWYFVAFFGFVAAVNTVMVTLAIRTHSGVVTEHAYEKGLAYNQVVQATEKQKEQGWKSKIEYSSGQLHFTLRDHDNHRITPESATATITRPTQQGMDFTMELENPDTKIEFPALGMWDIRVDADYQGAHYQQTKRIVVQ